MNEKKQFNGEEIEGYLFQLANTSLENNHLWRASYTLQDKKAKELITTWFQDKGFTTSFDAVGNFFGKLSSKEPNTKTIMIGSHLDTVKNAGMYDGTVGILLGLFAAGNLYNELGSPKINIEVAAFAEEEGSRYPEASYLGSRAVNGDVKPDELLLLDEAGISLKEAINIAGYASHDISSAKRNDILYYLEPHIEQGPVLDKHGIQIGIVNSITGFSLLTVTVLGQADHAGTTPMSYRRDALVVASKIISTLPGLIENGSGDVITTGTLQVYPGVSNVVPEKVVFTVDMRSMDTVRLQNLINRTIEVSKNAEMSGCKVMITESITLPSVSLSEEISQQLEQDAMKMGLSYLIMQSGAGHDCMHFAKRVPSAMFFLPSVEGRSHCPEEYTSPQQLSDGAALLACWLKKTAY